MTLLDMYTLTLKRLGNGAFITPSGIMPVPDAMDRDVQQIRPRTHWHSAPIVSQANSGLFVTGLLLRCGPAAISRLVVTVIVFAVYRVLGCRATANFSKKVCEGRKPKLNTAQGVIFGISALGQRASSFRQAVGFVFGTFSSTYSLSVRLVSVGYSFIFPASTGAAWACGMPQVTSQDSCNRSTGAAAQPYLIPTDGAYKTDDSPPTIPAAGKVNETLTIGQRLSLKHKPTIPFTGDMHNVKVVPAGQWREAELPKLPAQPLSITEVNR